MATDFRMREELIEKVREYPALYDLNHEDYKRTKFKDELWEKIAADLNITDGKAGVKDMWKKLRDGHRDALSRRKRKSGQGASVIHLWTFQKQMEFLLPYMNNNRPTLSSFAENFDSQSHILDVTVVDDEELDDLFHGSQTFDHEYGQMLNSLTPAEPTSAEPTLAEPPHKKKKKNPASDLEICLKGAEDRQNQRLLLRKELAGKIEEEKKDGMLQFFMAMCNFTKSMPLASQFRVKQKVFAIINEEEQQLLNVNSENTN